MAWSWLENAIAQYFDVLYGHVDDEFSLGDWSVDRTGIERPPDARPRPPLGQ